MKKYECLANWSLDKTNFKNSFPGLFRMGENGLFFQTENPFDGLYIEKIFGEKKENGLTKKDEKRVFTLVGCEESLADFSQVHSFKVSSFVDGVHLDENIAIKNIKIYFSNLKDWLEADFFHSFRPSSSTGENLHNAKNYSVTLNVPEDIVLLENERITIKIIFDNYYQSFVLDKKFEECVPYIEMTISDDNSYRSYIAEISRLRDFLTFATKTKTYINELSAVTEDNNFFRQYFFVPSGILSTYDFYMLFTYPLFQASNLHYGKWLKTLDSAPMECENFFLALEQEHDRSFGSIKLKFIYLVQAVEAWKRCESDLLFGQIEIEEINRVLDTINNQIVKKDKIKSFAGSLKKKTDLSQKIFQLINEKKDILDSIHLRLDKNTCDSIRDTRNYLAHLDPKKKNILTDEGLFWAAALLQVMMEIEFMKELGFTKDIIKNRISDPQKGNIYRTYFAGSHFPVYSNP